MKTKEKAPMFTINTEVQVSQERLKDLLITALDGDYGGSNFWVGRASVSKGGGLLNTPPEGTGFFDVPFLYGCGILVFEDEEGDSPETPRFITLATMHRGLQRLADKYPKHFADFISENEDANTADVWLQLVCFGEVVYG